MENKRKAGSIILSQAPKTNKNIFFFCVFMTFFFCYYRDEMRSKNNVGNLQK